MSLALLLVLVGTPAMAADPAALAAPVPTSAPFLLGLPPQDGPVVVRTGFDLNDINGVDDRSETFEFAGVLTLEWRDPRQAFDPAVAGVDEKIFQGSYQFDELATGWYPQLVLVNEAGLNETSGVLLRVRPDGTSTLVSTLNAVAQSEFDMRRFPFDSQRLQAVFEVLGFDVDEVVLQVDAEAGRAAADSVRVPQWTVTAVAASVDQRPAAYAGRRGVSSAFVVSIDVQRQSWFARRLIVAPLALIVVLSFSVFWMDRSSLGDRVSVSFVGILTAVVYQLVTSDYLPRISYVTLIHGFLNVSFLTMCATVVVSLVVGMLDKQGKLELGDRIDRRCRWLFPLVYFGLIFLMLGYELIGH